MLVNHLGSFGTHGSNHPAVLAKAMCQQQPRRDADVEGQKSGEESYP